VWGWWGAAPSWEGLLGLLGVTVGVLWWVAGEGAGEGAGVSGGYFLVKLYKTAINLQLFDYQ